ncbi:zinc metalloproteinase nas-39-like [Acropora palmata]|uniref:zinc metalloproteinase nas-39-like n=1 Tax=Acropora palmata TaxID=6131 RepID=UPI003D9FF5FF
MTSLIQILTVATISFAVVESASPPWPLNLVPQKLLPRQHQGNCGGPLLPPSGNLASPFYPDNYPNNAYCAWTITVPQGSILRIDFLFFETEPCYDYVKVFLGTRLLYRLGGKDDDHEYLQKIDADDDDDDDDDDKCDDYDRNDKDDNDKDDDDDDDDEKRSIRKRFYEPKSRRRDSSVVSIQGTGEVVKIVFRSDPWVTRRGFFAHYSLGQAVICGSPLVGPTGNFSSPGFPAQYPNDAHCRWSIPVPRGSILMLNFLTFETERCHDYVEITQGWRVIKRLSGVYKPYGWFKGQDDDDDDCDDDDDDDNDDDDDHDDDDKKKYGFGRFFGFPYVYIPGTGEEIVITFESDRIITRQGFDAAYRVLQGGLFGK